MVCELAAMPLKPKVILKYVYEDKRKGFIV